MFEVLVFVYENYWRGDACPELQQLGRRLSAHGFEPEEIHDALVWLDGLNSAAQAIRLEPSPAPAEGLRSSSPSASGLGAGLAALDTSPAHHQSPHSLRVYSVAEQDHLGAQCLGFISFLESAGVLPPHMREIAIDRAMAAPGDPVSLDELKLIVLMVYWSFGAEPDALVLDELCDDTEHRVAH
jgi:Smg protein